MNSCSRCLSFLLCCLFLTGCLPNPIPPTDFLASSNQVVRISCKEDPKTLDPRRADDLSSSTFLHMLYEGLMRLSYHGKPEPALAISHQISPDLTVYTFKLRSSTWSNADPLTAHDFEFTWKSMLHPDFYTPFAETLYLIKGAKAAKEGRGTLLDVKINAVDAETLVVELEQPASYFLEMLCTPMFYPVHARSSDAKPITNGPFQVDHWIKRDEFAVVKNPRYWEAYEVHLDGVVVKMLNDQTALRMYEDRELSWTGAPLNTLPEESIVTLKHQHKLQTIAADSVRWLRFNAEHPPFNEEKMRRAFALAIDRKNLINTIFIHGAKPAEAVVPPPLGLGPRSYFEDHDTPAAWFSFQEGLEKMELSKDDFPLCTLSYIDNPSTHKLAEALKTQWEKAFAIEIKLKALESGPFSDHIERGNFDIADEMHFATYGDPVSILHLFQEDVKIDRKVRELLLKSAKEPLGPARLQTLNEAQQLIMQEMPVAPLFFGTFHFVKDENLLGVYFSDLGYLDFKYAFFGS